MIGASVLPDDGIPVARPYVSEPAGEDPAAELQAMAWAASVARKRRGPRADERWGVGTVLRVALGCLFLLIACVVIVDTLESPTDAVIALVFGLLLAATGATNIVAAITGWNSAIPVVLNVVLGALFFVAIFLRFASLL